jgi:4-amino-4-deoxy-L-arabinose transferase-like glycosyltransferase
VTALARLARSVDRPRLRAALVLALAFAVFVGSGAPAASLSGDTAVYAQVGREIVERGDPTRLTLDGEPYRLKPPLVPWVEAAAFSVLGFTESAARLPARLFGLATVLLLMLLVGRTHGRRAGWLAAFACTTWLVFQGAASTPRLDPALAFFTLAALAAFVRIDRRGPTPRRALGLGALVGLAILSKGPPGVLSVVALAVGAPLAGRGRLLLRVAPLAALAAVVVGGSWYALQTAREGGAFWDALRADLLRNTAQIQGGMQALSLYVNEVVLPAFPFAIGAVGGTALTVRRLARRRRRTLVETLFVVLCAALLCTLPLLRMHYARYFVVVVPALAGLAGIWAAPMLRRLSRRFPRPRPHRVVAAGIAFAVLVGYPVVLAAGLFPPRDKYAGLAAIARVYRREAPGVFAWPTWSARQEDGEPDAINAGQRAAVRFYLDLRLVPYDPADASQPRLVLFRYRFPDALPDEAAAFEARLRPVVVARERSFTLYRLP